MFSIPRQNRPCPVPASGRCGAGAQRIEVGPGCPLSPGSCAFYLPHRADWQSFRPGCPADALADSASLFGFAVGRSLWCCDSDLVSGILCVGLVRSSSLFGALVGGGSCTRLGFYRDAGVFLQGLQLFTTGDGCGFCLQYGADCQLAFCRALDIAPARSFWAIAHFVGGQRSSSSGFYRVYPTDGQFHL